MTSVDAKALAAIQHVGRVDKGGFAAIGHADRVAAGAERRAVRAKAAGLAIDVDHTVQAAWLHDVVEDTPLTVADLQHYGFSLEVAGMVALLTKRSGHEPYTEKLRPLLRSGNLGALLVKLADNEDNTGPDRPHVEGRLLVRYAAARTLLLRELADLGFTEA